MADFDGIAFFRLRSNAGNAGSVTNDVVDRDGTALFRLRQSIRGSSKIGDVVDREGTVACNKTRVRQNTHTVTN